MADRVERFTVTVPAGTTQAAPQVSTLDMLPGVVTTIEIDVPPGPSGLVGFAIFHSGVQVIPFKLGTFLVFDDVHKAWNLSNFPTGDKWSVRAYNTDVDSHQLMFTFLLDEFGSKARSSTVEILPQQSDQPARAIEWKGASA